MDQINFSIIIPCFNSNATISRTLESIVKQNYDLKKVEVIIIDDCSTDSTLKVIKSFSGLNKLGFVNVFETETNLGPGVARNIGIEASMGRYVLFLDSDDTLNDFSLKKIDDANLNSADIVFFDGQLISEEPSIICKHMKMLVVSDYTKAKALLNLETDEHVIFSAYRRDFIYHLPRFRAGVYEDVLFSGWAYFHAQSIEHLPCTLVNKFKTPGQITASMTLIKAKQYISARLELTRNIMESLPEHGQELEYFFNSGLRGSIAVTLKKLEICSVNQGNWNHDLRGFFEFLSGEIDNLDSIVLNHTNTNKDIEAFNFYIDWKKIFDE
jgi:glycosyltransferase involved in cell wall biosynthesis